MDFLYHLHYELFLDQGKKVNPLSLRALQVGDFLQQQLRSQKVHTICNIKHCSMNMKSNIMFNIIL